MLSGRKHRFKEKHPGASSNSKGRLGVAERFIVPSIYLALCPFNSRTPPMNVAGQMASLLEVTFPGLLCMCV